MIYALNIGTIALVLLIAYWWANQGLFSAILHLLCVVVAGAIALAFWEPLTLGLLLRGSATDSFAWGVSLVGLFAVSLFVLRLATDRLVPANVHLPHWANLAFGFPVGALAGTLSIGMLILGAGFIQSERSILGFTGWARSARTGVVDEVGPKMWLPVHQVTYEFYSLLSVNALSTARPLRHYNPDLHTQAASLVRDSAKRGRGQTSLPPSGASIRATYLCPDLRRCAVVISFTRDAMDFGEQLTISAAQVRLVGSAQGMAKPYVSHPVGWTQQTKDAGIKAFRFDDLSHYITSVPGRQAADVTIEFPFPTEDTPSFIQIKGTRFDLTNVQNLSRAACEEVLGGISLSAAVPTQPLDFSGAKALDPADLLISNSIRPVNVSTNQLPSGMKATEERLLLQGNAVFKRTRGYISRQLRVEGIYEPPQTRLVQVDVSRRQSSADIFGSVQQRAGTQTAPILVDNQGFEYSAMGYIHESPGGVRIVLDPSRGIRSMEDLPQLPSSGDQRLRLLFRVTEGVTIVAFRLGNVTVGTCNLNVEEK